MLSRESSKAGRRADNESGVVLSSIPHLPCRPPPAFHPPLPRYWDEKGLAVALTSRLLNLAALAFTIATSALLLLFVDWAALHADCIRADSCDIWDAAVRRHPLAGRGGAWPLLVVTYLAALTAYWAFAAVRGLEGRATGCRLRWGRSSGAALG